MSHTVCNIEALAFHTGSLSSDYSRPDAHLMHNRSYHLSSRLRHRPRKSKGAIAPVIAIIALRISTSLRETDDKANKIEEKQPADRIGSAPGFP
jgi:hypothetical protein